MIWSATVYHAGRPVAPATVNRRMEAADPGWWGEDHSLRWSCAVSARRGAELLQDTLGSQYRVELKPEGSR